MKKLNITKERFEKSRYFKNKYGKLEYVSESGKLFKTSKGQVLMFNESDDEIGDAVQDAYDKYRACRTEPKVCHAIKINDDGTEKKIGIWMDRGNSIGGIVKAIRDGRLRKVLNFSESSKPKFVKESGEELYAEINIWPDDLRMWDDLLNQEIDYDEYDFDEESTVFQETARFEDGCFADLKVNTNDREDGTLWAEVVLFDKDGHQLAYTEPNYSGISGEWELEANGKTYIVSVGSR